MKKATRITSVLMVLILALSLQTSVFAQEQQTQTQTQVQTQAQTQATEAAPVEQPSVWAFDGVNWSAIYGLARQDMFARYASKVNREELYAVGDNLYTRVTGKTIVPVKKSPFTDTDSPAVLAACAIGILSGEGRFEPAKEATRLEMVTVIYNTLKAANVGLKFDSTAALTAVDAGEIPAASLEAVKYSVAKGLLKGVGNNILGLSAPCSRQELMVFARRAYELAVYETGNDSKGVLWKASDKDSTVYLLGSVHVANPSIYPLSRAMLNAFEKSDTLVVEADISTQNEGIIYMQQKMMLPGSDTLDKVVSKEVYDQFVEAIKPLGLKPEVYNKLKLWSAAMLVQNAQMAQNSYSANLGIDLYFTAKATGKKPIIEIEGLKFQVDMFDSFSKELQEQYLSATLTPDKSSQQKQADVITAMMNAWKTGDAAEIEKLVAAEDVDSVEAKEYNEKLWTTRNENMYQKTKTYLADPTKKTYFIVVGAGHMEGKNGIVTQLENNGYVVEQLK